MFKNKIATLLLALSLVLSFSIPVFALYGSGDSVSFTGVIGLRQYNVYLQEDVDYITKDKVTLYESNWSQAVLTGTLTVKYRKHGDPDDPLVTKTIEFSDESSVSISIPRGYNCKYAKAEFYLTDPDTEFRSSPQELSFDETN